MTTTTEHHEPGVTSREDGDWRARLRNSRTGNLAVLAVTFALVLGGAYLLSDDKAPDKQAGVSSVQLTGDTSAPPPAVGRPAAGFTATTIDGKPISLADFKGRPVWLTFGASWCASCRSEAADVQAVASANAGSAQGPVVIGVYISEDQAAASSYAQRLGLTYPQIADPQTTIASAYRVDGIPAHYFIDRDGVIRSIQVGVLSKAQIEKNLAGL